MTHSDDSPFGPDRKRRKTIITPDPPCPPGVNPAEHKRACARARLDKPEPEKKPGVFHARYSKDYAKKRCKLLGLTILQEEVTKRHWNRHTEKWETTTHDLPMGSDLGCTNHVHPVYIQAGCAGSRKEHYQRFLDRNGPELCKSLGDFVYWEFDREGHLLIDEVWGRFGR